MAKTIKITGRMLRSLIREVLLNEGYDVYDQSGRLTGRSNSPLDSEGPIRSDPRAGDVITRAGLESKDPNDGTAIWVSKNDPENPVKFVKIISADVMADLAFATPESIRHYGSSKYKTLPREQFLHLYARQKTWDEEKKWRQQHDKRKGQG